MRQGLASRLRQISITKASVNLLQDILQLTSVQKTCTTSAQRMLCGSVAADTRSEKGFTRHPGPMCVASTVPMKPTYYLEQQPAPATAL